MSNGYQISWNDVQQKTMIKHGKITVSAFFFFHSNLIFYFRHYAIKAAIQIGYYDQTAKRHPFLGAFGYLYTVFAELYSLFRWEHKVELGLKENKASIDSMQKGAAQPRVYAKDLNAMKAVIPCGHTMGRCREIVEPMFGKIGQLEMQIKYLAEAPTACSPN